MTSDDPILLTKFSYSYNDGLGDIRGVSFNVIVELILMTTTRLPLEGATFRRKPKGNYEDKIKIIFEEVGKC